MFNNSAQQVISNLEKSVQEIIQNAIDNEIESVLIEENVKDIFKFIDDARMTTKSDNPYKIAKNTVRLWQKHIKQNSKAIIKGVEALK